MKLTKGSAWRWFLAPLAITAMVVTGIAPGTVPTAAAETAPAAAETLQEAFRSAAAEFGVPESILLSVSYNVSRWEHHDGEPSTSGGYGLMHLTSVDQVSLHDHDKGEEDLIERVLDYDPALHTLETAAGLLGVDPSELKADPAQNIRGGAALLAEYAKATTGALPADEADWYGAVAKFSGSDEDLIALGFADSVYTTLGAGAERVTLSGQHVRLVKRSVTPNKATADGLALRNVKWTGADCPNGIACRFIPAFYGKTSATGYGNYDTADRPRFGPEIRYIVIHDTEGSYLGSINWFRDKRSGVSAHYVIRANDGEVTQMVDVKDTAWQAGNWYFNMHTIGIEHEGVAIEGAAWYSEQMYRSSASLVRYLANKYGVPLDRAHIMGHDEVPGLTAARQSAMHWDPGPFWDWEHYMALLGAPITPAGGDSRIVTIRPHFETNRPEINGVPAQPANFLPLYTQPSFDAPLFRDNALPTANPRNASTWGSKVRAGQRYYLAERQGDWDAIWYGGKKAWFYNPDQSNTVPGKGILIRPKTGSGAIKVYGGAYPEEKAVYPDWMAPKVNAALQYSLAEGQVYVAFEKVKSDYYYANTYSPDPYSGQHFQVNGNEEYYRIQLGHRFGFVKATDVEVVGE